MPSVHPTLPLAIITGASSGMGREIAILLAHHGYRTILIARRAQLLRALATELSSHAPSYAFPLDLTDFPALDTTFARILTDHGPPSVLVNCAGSGTYAPFIEQSPEQSAAIMRLNHEAAARTIRALLPAMAEHARTAPQPHFARIISICSMSARLGPWGHAAYASSKAAMRSLTESLACEHGCGGLFGWGGPCAVRFTAVYPGIIDTPYFKSPAMAPLWPIVARRAIPPQRVARAVVNNLRRGRPALYIPRHYRFIDLIAALSPSLALRLVRGGSQ